MRGIKVRAAIRGWFVGVILSLGGSVLVALGLNAWQGYRWGLSIGLFAIAIVFWGLVVGVLILGPIVAWRAVRRTKDPSRSTGRKARQGARSMRLVLVLSLVATLLVAGAVVCLGVGWAPCRGFPAHERSSPTKWCSSHRAGQC